MAAGIDWLARLVWIRGAAAIMAWGLTTLIVVLDPHVRGRQFIVQKQWPHATVAKFLHSQMGKNDVIVTGWSVGFTLSQFFNDPERSHHAA